MKAEWTSPLESFSLVAQAKEAYEQKRTRECMALTKALLLTDPTNSEALALQGAIRTDMQRDMNDARALLEDSRHQEDPQKHRKAAEIILLKILYLDSENEQAKILLSAARASEAHAPRVNRSAPKRLPATVPEPSPVKVVPEVKVVEPSTKIEDEHTFERTAEPVANSEDDIPFVVAPLTEKKRDKGPRLKVPFIFIILAVGAVAIFLARQSQSSKQQKLVNAAVTPVQTPVPQTNPQTTTQTLSTDHLLPAPTAALPPVTTSHTAVPSTTSVPATQPSVAEPLKTRVSAPPSPVAYEPANLSAVGTGKLAISSPTSADIYAGDKHMGSTPITLDLPAGTHTLEYRHDNLRTVATHVVKPNETTTALITFEIVVQINSRPWAQVYLDGAQRRALGQTPLSDVKVPIGRILVFENPNFPSKSYRITGKETAIQMVFP